MADSDYCPVFAWFGDNSNTTNGGDGFDERSFILQRERGSRPQDARWSSFW